jgi:four helix bundle protein
MNETNKIKEFTDLNSWREAHKLVLLTYRLTHKFPKEEIFGLTNQARRASVSITSNIAEGFGRQTFKDRIHFYYMAQGSLSELKNQILIARDILYINKNDFQLFEEQLIIAHKFLQGLISKSKTFIKS